jgi:hypothetical protein
MSEENQVTLGFAPVIVEAAGELIAGIADLVFASGSAALTSTRPLPDKLDTRKQVKVKTSEDGRHVVKVYDAIACVEAGLNGDVVAGFVAAIIKGQLSGSLGPIDTAFDEFAKRIAECIRAKQLKQTNPKGKGYKHRSRRTSG